MRRPFAWVRPPSGDERTKRCMSMYARGRRCSLRMDTVWEYDFVDQRCV